MDKVERDATALYYNSLHGIFDDLKSPSRKLKEDFLIDYLKGHWGIIFKENPGTGRPFWPYFEDKLEGGWVGPINIATGYEIDTDDVIVYLLTDRFPENQIWTRRAVFTPLSLAEKIDLIHVIEQTIVGHWSVEDCDVHSGMAGMIKTLSAIANGLQDETWGSSKEVVHSAVKKMISHIAQNVADFEADTTDFPTMFALATVFTKLHLGFFLDLPRGTHDYNGALYPLAGAALHVMTVPEDLQSDSAHLFDDDLMPFAMLAQAIAGQDPGDIVNLAESRYGKYIPEDLQVYTANIGGEMRKGTYDYERSVFWGHRFLWHFGYEPQEPVPPAFVARPAPQPTA